MKTTALAASLACVAVCALGQPVLAQATPQSRIPEIVRTASIEGVRLGMTQAEATSILVAKGYQAQPDPGPPASVSPRGYRPPCCAPTDTHGQKFFLPPGKVSSDVTISFKCSDKTIFTIRRDARTSYDGPKGSSPVTTLTYFNEAKPIFELLCPPPAEDVAKGRMLQRTGVASDLKTGLIECSGMQTKIGASYKKQEAGAIYSYGMSLIGYATHTEYAVTLSVSKNAGR